MDEWAEGYVKEENIKFSNIFSSLNFLVYFGFSRKFQRGLVSLLIGGKNKSGVRDSILPLTPLSAILIYAPFDFTTNVLKLY